MFRQNVQNMTDIPADIVEWASCKAGKTEYTCGLYGLTSLVSPPRVLNTNYARGSVSNSENYAKQMFYFKMILDISKHR